MFEKLLKALVYFWGIVLVVFIFKIFSSSVSGLFDFNVDRLLSHFYIEASETNLSSMSRSTTSLDQLKLEKNYGMMIQNIQSCPVFYPGTVERDRRCEEPDKYRSSSHCSNGVCTLSVEFGTTYPERVGVCIKRGEECQLQYFDVPEEPEVIGYTTTFRVTDVLKEEFGIHSWDDEIRLEGASGYQSKGSFIEGEVYTFFYDYKPESDAFYVNDVFQQKVNFSEEK